MDDRQLIPDGEVPGYPRHIVAVGALVTNLQGDVLLMRHPRRGWEFPGGQVEEGESLIQALCREVLEETGVTITVGSLVGIYSNVKPPTKLILDFLASYWEGGLKTSSESPEVKWVKRSEAMAYVTHPAILDRMKDMLNFDQKVVYRVYGNDPYQVFAETELTSGEEGRNKDA